MVRSFVSSFVFAAVAACAMLAAPEASARSMGGFSINTTGPVTPTPNDPWGGVELCTAHLRKWDNNLNQWVYHMASGYSYSTCMTNAQPYLAAGYSHNPNPGFGLCQCHPGYNGFMVASPGGNGPLGLQNLTLEQVQRYDEGLLRLREKYQLDQFAEEHELLLQSIAPVEATPVEPR